MTPRALFVGVGLSLALGACEQDPSVPLLPDAGQDQAGEHSDVVEALGFDPEQAGWRYVGVQQVRAFEDSDVGEAELEARERQRERLKDRAITRRTYTLVLEDGRTFEREVSLEEEEPAIDFLPGSDDPIPVASIHGTDDRWIVTSENTLSSFPYRAIGSQLGSETSLSGSCTGGLIGPRHVLTAGHCVYSANSNSWLWNRWWSPGHKGRGSDRFVNGTPRRVVGLLSVSDWYDKEIKAADYGMQILADEQRTASLGWFGLCHYSDSAMEDKTVRLYGYPVHTNDCSGAGSPHSDGNCDGFMYGDICPIDDTTSKQLEYQCDTQGGQSGSPVWLYSSSGNPCIVGVHAYSSGRATRITSGRLSLLWDWVCDFPSAHATHGACN